MALNESEFQFVTDLKEWTETHEKKLQEEGVELFLLRNLSRGKGVGFFEAGNFHPDFILWMIDRDKQYVTFIEPHGLLHEGPASDKVQFHKHIKEIETPSPIRTLFQQLYFVLDKISPTCWEYHRKRWKPSVLFMTDNRDGYIEKLLDNLRVTVKKIL